MTFYLKDLCKTVLYNNDIFCRYDILLKYLAVHDWHVLKKINDLYWRMQFVELFSNIKDQIEMMSTVEYKNNIYLQKQRLIEKVEVSVNSNNYYPFTEPILVDKDFNLVDGSHRLAALMYFNINEVKVQVDYNLCIEKQSGKGRLLAGLINDDEWKQVITFCKERGVLQ